MHQLQEPEEQKAHLEGGEGRDHSQKGQQRLCDPGSAELRKSKDTKQCCILFRKAYFGCNSIKYTQGREIQTG